MPPYESRLTGPITASSTTSKVFSIGALLKSSGGGLIRVGRGVSFDSSSDFPIVLKSINDEWDGEVGHNVTPRVSSVCHTVKRSRCKTTESMVNT